MNRILVTGYTPFSDGINTFIKNVYPYIDSELFQFDFLVPEQYRSRIERLGKFNTFGGDIYYLDYTRHEMPLKSQKELKKILYSIPDLSGIHVHDISHMTYPLYLADRIGLSIKVIQFHCALPKHETLPTIDPKTEESLNLIRGNQFDRLACSDLAGLRGYRGMSFEVIPNGIIPENYSFNPLYRKLVREKLSIGDDKYVIGFFANISEVKNPMFALRVFTEFLSLAPGSLFLFVGANNGQKDIHDYVSEHGISENVRFLHTDESIDMLYCAADLALCTSLREGIGYAWIEAQANGLPCLISDEVTDQIKITNLAHMMSLEASPKMWAKKALQILQSQDARVSRITEIINHGFHAKESAQMLQDIYLRRL